MTEVTADPTCRPCPLTWKPWWKPPWRLADATGAGAATLD
jgi:hypothetical protein